MNFSTKLKMQPNKTEKVNPKYKAGFRQEKYYHTRAET